MEQVSCPACGLQMNANTFANCPNCHTLMESPPAATTPPPPGDPQPPATGTQAPAGDDQGPGITIGPGADEPPAYDPAETAPAAPGATEPEQPA